MRIKALLFAFVFAVPFAGIAQGLVLSPAQGEFHVDETLKLILYYQGTLDAYQDLGDKESLAVESEKGSFMFAAVPDRLSYGTSYSLQKEGGEYELFFTSFPVLTIDVRGSGNIPNDPKVLADFAYKDAEQYFRSMIGVELRGGISKTYPKKTYDIELWEDPKGEGTEKAKFGDLRKDDDWILDALYNEPLRVRSHVTHKLWLRMHSPYYLEDEDEAKSGADVNFVELFLNGRYNGIYNLSEQVDKKQLQLKSHKGQLRGELYKGSRWDDPVKFEGNKPFSNNKDTWGGWETKYPDDVGEFDWTNLHAFTEFVVNASDEDFAEDFGKKFHMGNLADYFIFLNLLRATDNTGKNTYLAKVDAGDPYFYVPWDLDGVYGTIWTGKRENVSNDILSNGMFDRVIGLNAGNFNEKVRRRWHALREGLLSEENLKKDLADAIQVLKDNNVYARERKVYGNYAFGDADAAYMYDWLERRLDYLDRYFKFEIKVEDADHGTVRLSMTKAKLGEKVTCEAVPDEGYHLTALYLDGEKVNPTDEGAYVIEQVKGNHTLKAAFGKNMYAVNVTVGKGGSVSPGEQTVAFGDRPVFEIVPDESHGIRDVILKVGENEEKNVSAAVFKSGGVFMYRAPAVKATMTLKVSFNMLLGLRENGLRLHPNPAVDRISVDGLRKGDVIVLVDANGAEIMRRTSAGNGLDLDVSGFARGVYFLRLNDRETFRVLKE